MLDPDPDEMNADPQPWFFSKIIKNLKFCENFLENCLAFSVFAKIIQFFFKNR
jgi:hypothetical protein